MSINEEMYKQDLERAARWESEARQHAEREHEKFQHERAKAHLDQEFAKVNRRELANWPDQRLAAWQAQFPPESAQFILAQFEWNRRLAADQIKAARWAAWIGLVGVIVGAVLTRILEKL